MKLSTKCKIVKIMMKEVLQKTSRSEDESHNELPQYQQGNMINNIPRNMQVKCEQKDPNVVSGLLQKKPADEKVGQIMSNLGNEASGEILDSSTTVNKDLPSSVSEATKTVTVNQSSNTTIKSDAKPEPMTHPEKESDFVKPNIRDKPGEVLQNGVSHVNNEGNLTDIILKDLENDFEDMLQNISDNNSSVSQTPTNNSVKATISQPKSKEKKESKSLNNNMMNNSIARSSEFPTSVPNMATLVNTPPYPNGIGNLQMRPHGPSPMGIGPQIRRHLVDHIQGRGRQQVGPAPYGPMNSMPVREPLVTGTQTKNPENNGQSSRACVIQEANAAETYGNYAATGTAANATTLPATNIPAAINANGPGCTTSTAA